MHLDLYFLIYPNLSVLALPITKMTPKKIFGKEYMNFYCNFFFLTFIPILFDFPQLIRFGLYGLKYLALLIVEMTQKVNFI